MTSPNTSVWLSLLRSIVMAICGVLVTKGIVSAADAPAIQTALETLLPSAVAAGTAWWGARTHTDKNTIAAAAEVPGVTQINVAPLATGGASEAAHDPDLPTVKKVL